MTIGSLASGKRSVLFYASSEAVQTFEDMELKSSVSYSEHKRHMKRPLLEMTGINPDEISFKMTLSILLGATPRATHHALYYMMTEGELVTLVLGETVIGGKWVVTDVSKAYKHLYKDGKQISCEVSVTLKGYN